MTLFEKGVLMVVLVLAAAIYFLPMIAGIYVEQQDRKKRGEPDNTKAHRRGRPWTPVG